MEEQVLSFISRFTCGGTRQQVIECFTQGCCYWFAGVLHSRFPYSDIVYDPVPGHFGCCIDGYVYDITGDVTGAGEWISWAELQAREPNVAFRIREGCICF